jgi:hypothetical protein
MAWPKGKPRKPKAPEAAPVSTKPVVSAIVGEGTDKKALTGVASTKREGGKSALLAENATIAAAQAAPEGEKSPREKAEDKFVEQTYNLEASEATDTTEQPQETEETTSATEEVQSVPEETVEAPSETVEEQESTRTYTEEEHKAAIDRMHQATTEAANYRKYLEEVSPHVNWDKFTQTRGETTVAGPTEATPTAEMPTQEEFISDYPSWLKKFEKYTASKQNPEIQKAIQHQNDLQTCITAFNDEFKDLDKRVAKDPTFKTKPMSEVYAEVLPEFREFTKTMKPTAIQPQKKKIPLESPSKAKEREAAGPEKPMTWEDVESDRRAYVKFKQDETRRLKGGY